MFDLMVAMAETDLKINSVSGEDNSDLPEFRPHENDVGRFGD